MLFFSFFFQSSFYEGNFISFLLYLFIKGLIFVILSTWFPISSWFNAIVTAYCKHLLPFSLTGFFVFLFWSNQENLYIIPNNLDLFYDIYNTIWSMWTWSTTNSLPSIFSSKLIWCLLKIDSALSLIMISMLSFSECITCSSSLSLEETKLIAIVNWIFQVLDFLDYWWYL